MTIDLGRFYWMLTYYISGGFALFVMLWWGATAFQAWLTGRFGVGERLMVGMSLVAAGTAINNLLWIVGHYYRGTGRDDLARAWGDHWQLLFNVSTVAVIVGYIFHAITAALGPLRNKVIVWGGCLLWHALGLFLWWFIGGFDYRYV